MGYLIFLLNDIFSLIDYFEIYFRFLYVFLNVRILLERLISIYYNFVWRVRFKRSRFCKVNVLFSIKLFVKEFNRCI